MKYRNYKHIVDTQNTAKPMVATDINLFDAQENYLNTPGGTYDLAKGVNGMMPHRATDLLTKITNCAPGDEGRQLWEDALQLFFCGDQDLIDYVQMTVGMAAVGKVYVEALIEAANGKSILVAHWYKHDLTRIIDRLEALGVNYGQLDSDQSIEDWNAGRLEVGLIHPASAGHGLNLQSGGNTLVWFGIIWSLELYQQTVARLWRQGQESGTVVVQHIITADSIDERIMKALHAKGNMQARLIDAVKAEVSAYGRK